MDRYTTLTTLGTTVSESRPVSLLFLAVALVVAAAATVFVPDALAQERTPGMQAYQAANPLGAPPQNQEEARVGRYSTTALAPPPSARAPLAVVATVSFPRGHVQTVGEAIEHLLIRTGYRLDQQRLTGTAAAVLSMPLPDAHRRLGPYRVDQMLSVLLGDPWVLSIDSASRTVSYAAPGQAPSETQRPAAAATATERAPS